MNSRVPAVRRMDTVVMMGSIFLNNNYYFSKKLIKNWKIIKK